jgi:hypothetical protein
MAFLISHTWQLCTSNVDIKQLCTSTLDTKELLLQGVACHATTKMERSHNSAPITMLLHQRQSAVMLTCSSNPKATASKTERCHAHMQFQSQGYSIKDRALSCSHAVPIPRLQHQRQNAVMLIQHRSQGYSIKDRTLSCSRAVDQQFP